MLTSTDQNNNQTSWTYDGFTLAQLQDPQGDVTGYTPDLGGRTIKVAGPAGEPTHDPGSLVQAINYDPAGNPTQVTWGGTTPIRTEMQHFDAQNNLVEVDTSGQGLSSALVTKYAPDADGNITQVQAPNGALTSYTYDPLDERIQTDFLPSGLNLPRYTETAGYDLFGNATSSISWLGQIHTATLDAAGRPTVVTDSPSGSLPTTITTNPLFDLDGNLTVQTISEQTTPPSATPTQETYTTSAAYNALDWQTSSNDNNLLTTNYGYDALGRLRTLSLPLPTLTGTAVAVSTVS